MFSIRKVSYVSSKISWETSLVIIHSILRSLKRSCECDW